MAKKKKEPKKVVSNSAFKRAMVQMDMNKKGDKAIISYDDGSSYSVECL